MNDRNTVLEIAKKCLKSTTKNKKEEIKNIGEMRIWQKELSENVRKADEKIHRIMNRSSELTSEEVFQDVSFVNETDEKKIY